MSGLTEVVWFTCKTSQYPHNNWKYLVTNIIFERPVARDTCTIVAMMTYSSSFRLTLSNARCLLLCHYLYKLWNGKKQYPNQVKITHLSRMEGVKLMRKISLKVTCEKVKFSNCDFCNNFRDYEWSYI